MCTTNSCAINMTNSTGGTAIITLSHRYSTNPVQISLPTTIVNNGSSVILNPQFNTGVICFGQDYWACVVQVLDGPNKGVYTTQGTLQNPTKQCTLESEDASKTLAFSVSTNVLVLGLLSGACNTGMKPVQASELVIAKRQPEPVVA